MNSLTAGLAMLSKRPETPLTFQLPRRSRESQPYTAGTFGHLSVPRTTISSTAVLLTQSGEFPFHARSELALRGVVGIRRGGNEALDRLDHLGAPSRLGVADPLQLACEPDLLLVQMIELRVAPGNRRRIAADFRSEGAPPRVQVLPDGLAQRGERHQVLSFGSTRRGQCRHEISLERRNFTPIPRQPSRSPG